MHRPHVQEAEIEIDPAQLENFKIAITAQIEAAIRVEPGIVALYAVCEVDRDSDAYKSHLETAHFKQYKATTEKMIRSLKLVQATPIMLGAKAR
jgi:quinol monooxygenase YgiN